LGTNQKVGEGVSQKSKGSMEEKELDQIAGEDLLGKSPKLDIKIIKLNGKNGGFFEIKDGQEKYIGNEIEIIPLKARRIFVGFERDRKTGKVSRYFTNEHNSWREKVNLFVVEEDKRKLLDTGVSRDLRKKWEKLRMIQILYCLMDGEIVRLNIKGASLSNWFEFRDALEDRAYKYKIRVSQVEEESPIGNYFVMNFAVKEKLKDLTEVEKKMKEIHEKIVEIDSYYKEREEEMVRMLEGKEIDVKEDIPVVEEGEDLTKLVE